MTLCPRKALDVLRDSISWDAHYDKPLEPDEDEAAALAALTALIDVAAERELREHGPGCRCSLARALSATKGTESFGSLERP